MPSRVRVGSLRSPLSGLRSDRAALRARVRSLEDRERVREHVYAYCAIVDAGRTDELRNWFAPDAELLTRHGRYRGEGEIMEFYGARGRPHVSKRHFVTDIRILESQFPMEVDSTFLWTDAADGESIIGWGRYSDVIDVGARGVRTLRREICVDVDARLAVGWA